MFDKRFSIGLMLDNDLQRFNRLLTEYGRYISEIYFSLPLGEKFHTRHQIQKQFETKENITLFWELLYLAKELNINLELVLNTYRLTEKDVYDACKLLYEKNLDICSVAIIDRYYEVASRYFPDKQKICSYNNEIRFRDDYLNIKNEYSYYVIGNANIRNNSFIQELKNDKRCGIILLLNNGCSHNCNWCSNSSYCREIFNKNVEVYGLDYIYSLQSVMPFEIHEGIINDGLVDIYKLSTRNTTPEYTMSCLDSYINNINLDLVHQDKHNYLLWCRLGGFGNYLENLNFDNIMKYKKTICGR